MIVHPLAEAMRRAFGLSPTVEQNRQINTVTGCNSMPYTVGQPCSLDISDPENANQCYWCGFPLSTHKEST